MTYTAALRTYAAGSFGQPTRSQRGICFSFHITRPRFLSLPYPHPRRHPRPRWRPVPCLRRRSRRHKFHCLYLYLRLRIGFFKSAART